MSPFPSLTRFMLESVATAVVLVPVGSCIVKIWSTCFDLIEPGKPIRFSTRSVGIPP